MTGKIMSGEKLNGMAFDVAIAGRTVHVETISLDITDNSKPVQTRGVPDGFVRGDVSASGEIELDSQNFAILGEAAAKAGSWRDLPEADFLFFASAGKQELKIEAFGCKLLLSGLLSIDSKGGESTKHKLKYEVTSPDFIKINGVPVLSAVDVRDLMG